MPTVNLSPVGLAVEVQGNLLHSVQRLLCAANHLERTRHRAHAMTRIVVARGYRPATNEGEIERHRQRRIEPLIVRLIITLVEIANLQRRVKPRQNGGVPLQAVADTGAGAQHTRTQKGSIVRDTRIPYDPCLAKLPELFIVLRAAVKLIRLATKPSVLCADGVRLSLNLQPVALTMLAIIRVFDPVR